MSHLYRLNDARTRRPEIGKDIAHLEPALFQRYVQLLCLSFLSHFIFPDCQHHHHQYHHRHHDQENDLSSSPTTKLLILAENPLCILGVKREDPFPRHVGPAMFSEWTVSKVSK